MVPQPTATPRDTACINSFIAGMQISRVPGGRSKQKFTVGPNTFLWVLTMELASYHLSGGYYFEVATRFLENLSIPSLSYCAYLKAR